MKLLLPLLLVIVSACSHSHHATPAAAAVVASTKPRFAYVVGGDGTNYSILVCPFDADGVTLLACQNTSLVAATYPTFSYPQGISFNADASKVYVTTYVNSAGDPAAWECSVNSTDGTFSACSPYVITSPVNYFQAYGGITVNNANTTAYLADYYGNDLLVCPIGNDGNFAGSACTSTGATTLSGPIGIALNTTGTTAYIANSNAGVTVCNVSGSAFTDCINKIGDGAISLNDVYSVALNSAGTLVYMTEPYSNEVIVCSTSPSTSSTFASCFNANGGNTFDTPNGIVLNRAGTMAYITSYDNFPGNIYECPIKSDGTLDTCVGNHAGLTFSPTLTLVY